MGSEGRVTAPALVTLAAAAALASLAVTGCASRDGAAVSGVAAGTERPPIELTGATLVADGDSPRLLLSGSSPLTPTVYSRDGGKRVVVDLPGTVVAPGLEPPRPPRNVADRISQVTMRSFSELGRPHVQIEVVGSEPFAAEFEAGVSEAGARSLVLARKGTPAPSPESVQAAAVPVPVPEPVLLASAASVSSPPVASSSSPVVASAGPVASAVPEKQFFVRRDPSGAAASRLQAIYARKGAEETVVRLAGNGAFGYEAFLLENPPRWVVDLPGVKNGATPKSQEVRSGPVTRVRVSQFRNEPDAVTRVVFDLTEAVVPQLKTTATGLTVSFVPASAVGAVGAVSTVSTEAKSSPPQDPAAQAAVVVAAAPAATAVPAAGSYEAHEVEDQHEKVVPAPTAPPVADRGPVTPAAKPAEPAIVVAEVAEVAEVAAEAARPEAIKPPEAPVAVAGKDEKAPEKAPAPSAEAADVVIVRAAEVAAPSAPPAMAVAEKPAEKPAAKHAERPAEKPAASVPTAPTAVAAVADVAGAQAAPRAAAIPAATIAPGVVAAGTEVRVLPETKAAPAQAAQARSALPPRTRRRSSEESSRVEAAEALLLQQEGGSQTKDLGNPYEARVMGSSEKRYTGDPVSLNLKDADIKDTLQKFSEIADLNIVLDPEVRGTVTVSLNDIPWDQALELILKINGLGYSLEGNVMRIAPVAKLSGEESAKLALQKAQEQNRPLKTIMQKLSYAQGGKIVEAIKKVMTSRGDVFVDQRSNNLIIKELPENIPVVLDLIKNLDIPPHQVMIEARIVEATRTFAKQVGVSWSFTGAADTAHGNTTGLVFPNNIGVGGQVSLPSGTNLLNLSMGNVLDSIKLDFALSAAENRGLVKVISSPKVVTTQNQAAKIQSGFQIPVQTTVNNTTSVLYIDATTSLDVTPTITAEGTILMEIKIQRREPAAGINIAAGTNVPLVTRDAQTSLLVRDGGTAVIGGIMKLTANSQKNMIPALWKIPILGNLFKNASDSENNDELMIFITPRIVKNT